MNPDVRRRREVASAAAGVAWRLMGMEGIVQKQAWDLAHTPLHVEADH